MQSMSSAREVLTITLNPAIDRTVTVPAFEAGKVNRVEHVADHPGGKGVNVAVALADAGHAVAVTGFLGRENATTFADLFAARAIADQFIRITGRTRVGIKISDPIYQRTTDLNFPGLTPVQADLQALHAQVATPVAPWVVLAGSLPPEVPATIYRDLIATLRIAGRRVLLDSSGEPLRHALDAVPHIIKPNIHELEALVDKNLPDPESVVLAARELLAQGIELVVVSMGAEGALFIAPDQVIHARPPQVVVQSTVGAGDAMVAGIIAGHLRSLPLAATAQLATAFSVDAISHLGAGLSSRANVTSLMEQVTLEEWPGVRLP